MSLILVYITIVLVSLLVVSFVVTVNIPELKKPIIDLDFRVISTQLVILFAWVLIFAQTLRATTPEEATVNTAVFVLSIFIGILVIKSVIKEYEANNLTEKLINSLALYNKRLRELDKQKTDFIGLASHQLRTPNSVIAGYSSMLLEKDFGELDEHVEEVVKKINKTSQDLTEVINELIETTKMEQKTTKYTKTKFDIIDLLEETEDEFRDLTSRKSIELMSNFDRKISVNINGDKNKISQVLSNLMGNAVRYTENGHIKISARKIENKIKISISDTGIGIKEAELGEIFDKFARGSNVEEVDVTGSGLGLFIAKEIVEANNGVIWAESAGLGKGSTFKIEFPLEKGVSHLFRSRGETKKGD